MSGDFFGVDRLEGPQADVQRDIGDLRARLAAAVENVRREVQPGGRSGYRSFLFGVHRLVALFIGEFFGPANVGRERYVADSLQLLVYVSSFEKAERAFAPLAVL